jgi:hypothetical protein
VRDPTDIVGALMAMTAIDERQKLLWRVYIAFWDRAARDPLLCRAAAQRRSARLWQVKLIADILRARNGDRADLQSISQRLNALVQGISVLALAEKDQWSVERTRRVIADEVDLLLGRPSFRRIVAANRADCVRSASGESGYLMGNACFSFASARP